MAERRMFAKTIIDSDSFLDMPQSSQLLYFHLSMRADDEGFINNPKSIMRNVGCKDDDLKILATKKFIIPFPTGIVVIKHWWIHNYIQKDRFKETKYIDEKNLLELDENKSYRLQDTQCIQNVSKMDTQVRLGKYSINNKEKEIYKEKESKPSIQKNKYGEFQNVLLTDDEYCKLEKSNLLPYIEKLSSYIASKGKKYKSHYATILNWNRKDYPKEKVIPDWFNKNYEDEENNKIEDKEFKDFIKEFRK